MQPLVRPLFDGPLDIVGDVHGEMEALGALLDVLGYDARGEHPDGRRLVFLGDLCDRGPDSPAVLERVRDLVARGRAQCVLGNHELNLLRQDGKHGNHWYLDPSHPEQQPGDGTRAAGEFSHCKPAPDAMRPVWHAFFLGLPLALERSDLRVVHAAWHAPAIAALRDHLGRTVPEVYDHYDAEVSAHLTASGLGPRGKAQKAAYKVQLTDPGAVVPLLDALAAVDEVRQMGNPVRVVTSGLEAAATKPFWANGKWRMCDRVRWWDDYADATPVIVGHYWRVGDDDYEGPELSGGKPNLFEGSRSNAWMGKHRNVFCVDFSVGGRYRERAAVSAGLATSEPRRFTTRLGAVRWPEQTLVFDDGSAQPMTR